MNKGENGIALILVLGILALLVTLATTFAFNMRLEQKLLQMEGYGLAKASHITLVISCLQGFTHIAKNVSM